MQDNCGTSLVEAFDAVQISTHVQRLRHPDPADCGPGSRGVPMQPGGPVPAPNPDDPNACAVCGVVRFTYEPPALYCTSCAQRIKRNQVRCPTSKLPGIVLAWLAQVHRPRALQPTGISRAARRSLEPA